MAKYPKRQKVKRYRRSFYSREMRVKKGIGIAVLVLVMLGAAWLAAPHVLDWATHTWYTVVRKRDLSASSPASASASSVAENPASSAASEPAASSEAQPEVVTPAVDGTAIVEGSWAEADITALTEDASIRAAAQQLASQGVKYAVVTLKDATGVVYYASQVPAAAASPASVTVNPARVAAIFREEGLIPVAKLAAFRDPAGARADRTMAIGYTGQAYLWLDNKASADGKPWLNPYADAAVQYIGGLIDELHTAGFEQMVLENVQFPASTSSKQDYGTTNGVSRADQLRADMAVWEQRFGNGVTLWYSYTLAEVADTSSTLGVPAAQLGVKNLVVRVPSASTMTAEERAALVQAQTEAGLVQRHIGRDQQQQRHQHEPAELEGPDVHQERLLRAGVLDGGGHVVGVGRGVDGLDDDRRTRGAEQVQRGADKRLVRLEVDAGHGQQAGINHADQRRNSQNAEDHHDGGHIGRNVAHRQRAAEGAHDHDALKAEVDDAGVLREAAAEGDQDQHGSENQGVLQQQYHY